MELGAFTKVFPRPTLAETLDACRDAGVRSVQFNYSCAGLESMPEALDQDAVIDIADALMDRGISVAALSGTFNMAHPDVEVRRTGVARLAVLASTCKLLGTNLITICTGTRDPDDMWREHPGNTTEDAWADMFTSVRAGLDAVKQFGVRLAFEPEPGNVVRTARDGLRLIEEVGDPALGVVFDPANILAGIPGVDPVSGIREAIELVGYRVMLAHGKDLGSDGQPCAAGTGIVPWGEVVRGLIFAGYGGPLVCHGLTEDELPASFAKLELIPGVTRRQAI
jgi:sugar phosphate isomerase/epimerase